jgi:hypothetical protein
MGGLPQDEQDIGDTITSCRAAVLLRLRKEKYRRQSLNRMETKVEAAAFDSTAGAHD